MNYPLSHTLGCNLHSQSFLLLQSEFIREMKRKMSNTSFYDVLLHSNLPKAEQLELQGLYKKVDHKGTGITFYDLVQILRNFYTIDEDRKEMLLKDIMDKGIRIIDFPYLVSAAGTLRREREEKLDRGEQQDNEYYDAFVALGGNPDGSGYVTREHLIKTITHEFDLPFDANSPSEALEILSNDKLSFQQFKSIFDNPNDLPKRGGESLRRNDSMRSVRINNQDFYHYLQKINTSE